MSKTCKNKTILLVDDDEKTRLSGEAELRDQGYITHSVSSGLDAFQFLTRNPQVDLLILDCRMSPLLDLQVFEQLWAKNINIPVILFSGYPIYRNNFIRRFAEAYVTKSSDLIKLEEKIKDFLSLYGAVLIKRHDHVVFVQSICINRYLFAWDNKRKR